MALLGPPPPPWSTPNSPYQLAGWKETPHLEGESVGLNSALPIINCVLSLNVLSSQTWQGDFCDWFTLHKAQHTVGAQQTAASTLHPATCSS